ncbi:hypothetical protein CH06BL_38020 [Chromobacterium haemolyticum]|nr:hypothetical protein CH06BL_38020 [Chromobacterium haemolyticum]
MIESNHFVLVFYYSNKHLFAGDITARNSQIHRSKHEACARFESIDNALDAQVPPMYRFAAIHSPCGTYHFSRENGWEAQLR